MRSALITPSLTRLVLVKVLYNSYTWYRCECEIDELLVLLNSGRCMLVPMQSLLSVYCSFCSAFVCR